MLNTIISLNISKPPNQPEIMSHLFAQKKIGLSLFCGLLLAIFSVLSFTPYASSAAYAFDYSSLTEWKSVNAYAPVASVVFSPDQSMIAAGLDGKVQIYSDKLELIKDLKASDNKKPSSEVQPLGGSSTDHHWMMALAFSPDSKLIAAACYDGTVRIWDVKTGAETIFKDPKLTYDEWTARSHKGAVRSIAFSPDGSKIVSGGDDKAVKMWDVKSGNLLWNGEDHVFRVVAVAFSTDGNSVSTIGAKDIRIGYAGDVWDSSGEFKVWDVKSGQEKRSMTVNDFCSSGAKISTDGKVAVSSGVRTDNIWDVDQARKVYGFPNLTQSIITCFSPDSSFVVLGVPMNGAAGSFTSYNKRTSTTIRVLSLSDGQSLVNRGAAVAGGLGYGVSYVEVPVAVFSLAVSNDNRSIAFGCQDGTIQIWRVP